MDNLNDNNSDSSSSSSKELLSEKRIYKKDIWGKNSIFRINILLILSMAVVTAVVSAIYPYGLKDFLESSTMFIFFLVVMVTLLTPFLMAVIIERFADTAKSFKSILSRTILVWISALIVGEIIQLVFNSMPDSLSKIIAICTVSILLGGLFTAEAKEIDVASASDK